MSYLQIINFWHTILIATTKTGTMDTILIRKNNKKKYLAIGFFLFAVVGGLLYVSITKKRTLTVVKSELNIHTVATDYFEDFMVFQARVEPLNAMLITVLEGGVVQEIMVQNGEKVLQGHPLARLYNPNTELNYMQQETAIIEQINNLNKAKLDLRNQELNLAKDIVAIEHDVIEAKSLYELQKKLFEQEIIAVHTWEKTQEQFRFQQERLRLFQQSNHSTKQANQVQMKQLQQSIATMEKSLQILRNNKKNFLILAPATGRLSSFEPVLGQTYTQGQTLGKIDEMKGYVLRADVDEFYLSKVIPGQKGTVDCNGQPLAVVVTNVFPEIKSGRFQVELHFSGSETISLQQGLSFTVRLILSEKKKSLVLSKGSFYQETAGKWVFVVRGNVAERRDIVLGRENPLYYEIQSGLSPGDQVITSNYQDYKDIVQLNLK